MYSSKVYLTQGSINRLNKNSQLAKLLIENGIILVDEPLCKLQEPAFPITQVVRVEGEEKYIQLSTSSGMSLRDYFAAKIIQGMMVNGFQPIQYYSGTYSSEKEYPWIETAYKIADAMLKERERP